MGSITFLCLLTTPSTGFLIPRHLNPVKNLSSPWLQCGAHRRTIKRYLQSSSCVGILKDPHSPGFLLDHPAVTDCSGGLAQGKENQILFSLLAFPRGVLLQLCSKMSFTRTLRICRAEKNPFGGGGMKEHIRDGGNLQFLKAPSVSNGLVFLKGRDRWCSCGRWGVSGIFFSLGMTNVPASKGRLCLWLLQ